MSENPYHAPEASVADVQFIVGPRPPQVTRACRIYWAILIFSALSMLPGVRGDWWAHARGAVIAVVIAVNAALLIVVGLAIHATARRHNGGRWFLLLYALVDVLSTAGNATSILTETPLLVLWDVLSIPAEVAACVLLFRGAGAAWFRQTAVPSAP
jgi:hypothetical protein